MKAKQLFLAVAVVLATQVARADNYSGAGIGISEACRSLYKPSFSGGDCIHRDISFRGYVGTDLSDYFALEGSVDFAFDAGNIAEAALDMLLSSASDNGLYIDHSNANSYGTTGRWSVLNVGVHALGKLPLTDDFILFAGPSVGLGYTQVDRGVKYFNNEPSYYESTTHGFGTNYGLVFGFDYFTSRDTAVRVQWQNWRSLDSKAANNGHFNSNTLSINFRVNY